MSRRRLPAVQVDVRLEAYPDRVGNLSSFSDGLVSFQYDGAYLERADAIPISLSMPLQDPPHEGERSRSFFQNLLPENDQLEQAVERHRLERNDVVGLLFHLGADCPGALSCLPPNAPPAKSPGSLATDYDPLDAQVLLDIVTRLANRDPLPDGAQDPSPVAGVQRKIALAQLPDGRFAMPRPGSGAPTTHIIKVPRRAEGREAELESRAAYLARSCGLDVSVPQAFKIADIDALLITRFDRVIAADHTVTRLHQEDFVQALGLPPGAKYERRGQPGRVFDARAIRSVLERTSDPERARSDFAAATLFNMCIGNVDNHGKNHALLYPAGPTPTLSPLYDLLPTKLNNRYLEDFSFAIGRAGVLADLRTSDIVAFLLTLGFTPESVDALVIDRLTPMIMALDRAYGELPHRLKSFCDLIGRETDAVTRALGLTVDLQARDHYANQAGGWPAS